jgi:hypothetical protein
MVSLDPKRASTKRYELAVWHYRVRQVLVAVGYAFVIVGGISALRRFDTPISNPAAIPKADPAAGLAILQAIPWAYPYRLGVGLALLGVLLLLGSLLFRSGKPRTNSGNHE